MTFTKNKITRVAVIGANGFLGKSIIRQLLLTEHSVYAVFHRTSENIPEEVKKISILDFLKEKVEVDVIILVVGNFKNTHQELIQLNCTLVTQLIDLYYNSRFVFISSANVYGSHTGIISEQSEYNSPGLYGRAKLAGEFIVSMVPSFAIIRMVYLYGYGLNNDSFLTRIINQAQGEKKITLFGKGERKQDYLHVDDAAALCVKLAENNQNGIFIGASGKSISNLEVANIIKELIPGCIIEFQGDDIGQSFFFDVRRTWNQIGWKPKFDFLTGIKTMLT